MTNPELSTFRWGVIIPLAVTIVIASFWVIFFYHLGSNHFPTTTFAGLLSLYFLGSWLLTSHQQASRKRYLVILTFISMVFLLVSLSAFRFQSVTGVSLDFYLIYFSITNFREVLKVASSEASIMMYVLAADLAIILVLLPWIVYRRLERRSRSDIKERVYSTKRRHLTLFFGCVSLVGTTVSASGGGASSFMQNAWMQAMLSPSSWHLEEKPSYIDRQFSGSGNLTRKAMTENMPHLNVAIIILESVGMSVTTLHDPNLPTTPFLSQIAHSSKIYHNAFAVVPHTSKALVSILCGIEPNLRMAITEAKSGLPVNCLPKLLDQVGYETAFFQAATSKFENRTQLVANMGFKDFFSLESMNADGFESVNYFGYDDRIMLEPSRGWLESINETQKPFLATYLTVAPHHDYQNQNRDPALTAFSISDAHERYLNAVSIVDSFSEDLVQQYKDLGLYDSTIFVFIGDHGEAFGQHGRFQHDNVLWNEVLSVPLIIHVPWVTEQTIINESISQIDLLPTIVSQLGYKIENEQYPGHDLQRPLQDRKLFASCWYRFRCIAVIDGDQKFIEHYSWMAPDFFNMKSDPLEQNNLWSELETAFQHKLRREVFLWKTQVETAYDRLLQ